LAAEHLTEDRLLGGRVRFSQPAHGYRSAIDPVLLAAAVPAAPGERVLDAGSGTGAASLCLAARVPECRIVGLELQCELHRLASRNAVQNDFDRRVEMIKGDIDRPPPQLSGASFDHVMTNPPYLSAAAATVSSLGQLAIAHVEHELDLAGWLTACLRLLRPAGFLTLIHRADRAGDIMVALMGKVGDLVIFPLWPGPDQQPAKRLLLQGRKGLRGPLRLARGLTLHGRDGGFSAAAEAILRHGQALDLRAPRGRLADG
jgi:tRNA1(Val) A37 N6-methylase TrmN6